LGFSPEFVGELKGYWWFVARFFKVWEDKKNSGSSELRMRDHCKTAAKRGAFLGKGELILTQWAAIPAENTIRPFVRSG